MIPKVIHTYWFTKNPKNKLPEQFRKNIEKWKEDNPEYTVKVWSLSDWDTKSYSFAKECLEAGIYSYDYLKNLFKFWVLYYHGGFFLDHDSSISVSLDTINTGENLIFIEKDNYEISGKLLGGVKEHPVFKKILNIYKNKTWIKPDNSLNLYSEEIFLGEELIKVGYNYIDSPRRVKDAKLYKETEINIVSKSHLEKPRISVVIPVWNSEKYLRECIDSVLGQDYQNFEVICVDDGSTDRSEVIIKSYKDDRVVYISKKHSGIVDSLNIGIRRAQGDYIARFDSDDVMLPGRLSHQEKYMEDHPGIDILGSGFQWGNGKEVPEFWRCPERRVKLTDFSIGNIISHPTVFMKKESISKLPYLYENYFQGCEDYKLWHHAIKHGLSIHTEPTPVIIYRQHNNQVTQGEDYCKEINVYTNRVKRMYYGYKSEKANPELSCIIPFQNEGSEVERTVANIRGTAGANVEIILVNDASTDGYDYSWIADAYDCKYVENSVNHGVAGSRNRGVLECNTEYFLLLDAHMRFYDDNWHERLLRELKNNPGCIISTNTIIFTYDELTGLYKNEDAKEGKTNFGSFGAYINMKDPGWEFTAKWTGEILPGEKGELIQIPCCLGAVYSTSRSFWYKIGGLNGLMKYGLDEPLISIKTWLSGGKVLMFKNWGVGHLYRGKSPYSIPLKHLDQNQIYLINLFSKNQEQIDKYEGNLKNRLGEKRFEKAKNIFNENYKSFKDFKDYFYGEVAKYDFDWFINNINKVS